MGRADVTKEEHQPAPRRKSPQHRVGDRAKNEKKRDRCRSVSFSAWFKPG
jgi:hypothetical protein